MGREVSAALNSISIFIPTSQPLPLGVCFPIIGEKAGRFGWGDGGSFVWPLISPLISGQSPLRFAECSRARIRSASGIAASNRRARHCVGVRSNAFATRNSASVWMVGMLNF